MGRARMPTPEQRQAARQAASDALCDALGFERFTLDEQTQVPDPRFSPMTSPLWPIWFAKASRAEEHTTWRTTPRTAKGVCLGPAWGKPI